MLCGMDWLLSQKTMVYFYKRDIKCLYDDAEKKIWQGKKNPTSVRMFTTMQAKRSCRKWCVLFAVHISSEKGKDFEYDKVLKRYPTVHQFEDVFQA